MIAVHADIGILVTRPTGQAESLCRRIESLGWRAIPFPTVEIDPLDNAGPWFEEDYDYLIFVSRNAVTCGLSRIQGKNDALQYAAVGKGTASELKQHGKQVQIVPAERWDSEGLLTHPELNVVAGKKILILRGKGGRALLGDELTNRGAKVEYGEVYRRVQPTADTASLIEIWPEQIRLIIATSNEILANLAAMLGDIAPVLLRSTPLLVVSERGRVYAQSLGCEQVLVAESAGDEALVSAMLQWAESANL